MRKEFFVNIHLKDHKRRFSLLFEFINKSRSGSLDCKWIELRNCLFSGIISTQTFCNLQLASKRQKTVSLCVLHNRPRQTAINEQHSIGVGTIYILLFFIARTHNKSFTILNSPRMFAFINADYEWFFFFERIEQRHVCSQPNIP